MSPSAASAGALAEAAPGDVVRAKVVVTDLEPLCCRLPLFHGQLVEIWALIEYMR